MYAPSVEGKCYSAVKNLDDPKLIAYYSILQVADLNNVHRPITRAEFLKFVLNAASVPLDNEDVSTLKNFEDINQNAWYAKYLAYTLRMGALHGQNSYDPDGKQRFDADGNPLKIFRPDDQISRGEAAKILGEFTRKIGEKLPFGDEITSFADIKYDMPLARYVQYAYNQCLLHGRHTIDGEPLPGKPRLFEPYSYMSLAETAKVLYNITHFQETISSVIKPVQTLLDNAKTLENPEKSTLQPEISTGETTLKISDLLKK